MDFVRAANRAPDGRSIIALQSTNRDRTHSRIVARLADGVVTTPRAEADVVVTEYGIARLHPGRTRPRANCRGRAELPVRIGEGERKSALGFEADFAGVLAR